MVNLVSAKDILEYTPDYYLETGAEVAPVYKIRVPTLFDRAKLYREMAKHRCHDLTVGPVLRAAFAAIDIIAEAESDFDADGAKRVIREEIESLFTPGHKVSEEFLTLEKMLVHYQPYVTAVADLQHAWDVLPLVACQMFVTGCDQLGIKATMGVLSDADLARIPDADRMLVGFRIWGMLHPREDEKKD